jgi:hypothetical protein
MKKNILIFLLGILPASIWSQPAGIEPSNLHAFTQSKGSWATGLIHPFRIGITPTKELFTSALLLPLMPNAGIKIKLGSKNDYYYASEHSVSIPSVFLNTVSRKGTGGILSPEFDFPFILAMNHTALLSRILNTNSILSFRLGIAFSLKNGSVDPLSTIDMPVFFPRMAHYYSGISIRPGLNFIKKISTAWTFEEDVRLFLVTREFNNFCVENHGLIHWKSKGSFGIRFGYLMSYGYYPYGKQFQVWPQLDIRFGKKEKKN